jgi:hypothetical protein
MGVHTGEPSLTDEGYVGLAVHQAARIAAAGHGGQVVVSETTCALLDGEFELRDLGEHRLKDIGGTVRLFQLGRDQFPPLRSLSQGRLPVEPAPLLGRKDELDNVMVTTASDLDWQEAVSFGSYAAEAVERLVRRAEAGRRAAAEDPSGKIPAHLLARSQAARAKAEELGVRSC